MANLNILVICGRNKRRSRTAEYIFKNDNRFKIRSAGLSPQSNHKVNEKDIQWADLILVMESNHRNKLKGMFNYVEMPIIKVLDIDDVYEFLDEELIDLLNDKFNDILKEYKQ